MTPYERLVFCANQVREKINIKPRVGIVLGSGLGGLADEVEDAVKVKYSEIEEFPVSTAPGHVGQFVFGTLEGVPIVMMQGRIHLYEGYKTEDCVLPVRLLGMLGVETMILTNAAGAINEAYSVGDYCILKDHISSLVTSPLIGPNIDELGTRFPDMTEVYNKELRALIHKCANEIGATVHEGVYIQFTGPAYETPAEIKMARTMGADMAGMSTVIEAIALHHMGVRLAAISLATNMAAGLSGKLSEEEVIINGKKANATFRKLIHNVLKEI